MDALVAKHLVKDGVEAVLSRKPRGVTRTAPSLMFKRFAVS